MTRKVKLVCKFDASRFPHGTIGNRTYFRYDEDALGMALFTTGRASGDVAIHGVSSCWEFLHRFSIVPAYLSRTTNSKLAHAALYSWLDRSEKVPISYTLGGAMARLFCAEVLSVPVLLHIDRYGADLGTRFSSPRRPDYVGWSPSGWIVVEAKGRSATADSTLRQRVSTQKSAVRSVEGKKPRLAVGTIAHFPTGELSMVAVDPEEIDDQLEPLDLDIDVVGFFRSYYLPYSAALQFGRQVEGPEGYEVAELAPGIRLGLREDLLNLVRGDAVDRSAWAEAVVAASSGAPDLPKGHQIDGSFFSLDWVAALSGDDFGG